MLARRIVLVAIASVVLWGCGSDADTDSDAATDAATDTSGGDEPLPTAPASDDGSDGPVQVEIVIADFAFVGDQEVPAGGQVVVTNTDGASHTWSAVDGSFDSGTLGEGDSFEFTFPDPGTFEYVCNIHPSMTGSITVTG